MSGNFYRAFEDRHRGSRELIKNRLRVYLPFILPIISEVEATLALDLGCGRGEWLELLTENGFTAQGVDLDDDMLAACRQRGLSVETADAINSLGAYADNSLAVVSAFHLVEHLPFDKVQKLVAEALRVLRPGGILIMETPNPENPMVGACHFYLDPSHIRPVPPDLLSFLTEYTGFARQKVMRLQEEPSMHTAATIHLVNVFSSASPDYGVVAQKNAPAHVLELFEAPFQREFGIRIGELAQRFEEGQQIAVNERVSSAASLQQQQTAELSAQVVETRASVSNVEARLQNVSTSSNARAAELTAAMTASDLRLSQCAAQLADANLRIAEMHAQQERQSTTVTGILAEITEMHAQQERQSTMINGILAEIAEVHAQRALERGQQEQQNVAIASELTKLQSSLKAAESQIALREQELANAHTQLDAMYASTSWQVTAPLRRIATLLRFRR
jgi:SAM-dependent methyltransferase